MATVPPASRRRCRTQAMLQVETTECGVVCLAIVLGYYRRWIPIEALREAAGVSRDGSNAARLLQVARQNGLEAKGYSLESPDFDAIPKPAILHWRFNHFVVLEGSDGDRFWINDPASGRQVLDRREVEEAFTGVLLSLKPGPEFETSGSPPRWWQALAHYAKDVRSNLTLAAGLGLALVVPGVLMPMLSIIFVDQILVQGFHHWLPYVLGTIGVLTLLQWSLTAMQQRVALTLQTRLSVALNSRLLNKSLRLPITFFAQRSPSEMASRGQMVDQLSALIAGPLGRSIIGLATACVYFLVMLRYDVALSLCAGLLGVLNLGFFIWQVRRVREMNQVLARETNQFSGAQMQTLQLLPEVKTSGLEEQMLSSLVGRKIKWLNENNRLTQQRTLMDALPRFLQVASFAIVLVVGGLRVIDGAMSLGVLVAFQGLIAQFLGPIQQMLQHFTGLQQAQGAMDRIEDVFRQPDSKPSKPPEGSAPEAPSSAQAESSGAAFRPILKLDQVTFGYQQFEPPLLKDFSLELEPGRWIALVGPSGSGKSTVARLLCQLHHPWSGSITLGGRSIDEVPPDELRSTLAIVDQNIVLFNATVHDNLTLWNRQIGFEEVTAAADAAQIHDWIINRPQGYDHKVAENGGNLSGGEKARLEIARALASEPTLLILDEATAALDPAMERDVLREVRRRCAGGIIISHRLSAVSDCDEIIVFNHGRPVQRGTHESLMAESRGLYHKLQASEVA
ncbi:MAG: NHLP family bacteriocin export ABC transporter peptidase/permease/ATPase subunit [Synoicihabitans sp.]